MGHLPFERRDMKVLERTRTPGSEKFGTPPERRPTKQLLSQGIVVIDKPSGPTSHQVSAYVRQMLGLERAGHSGTLDPAVTGVLPVALGNGTRIVQALLTAGKEYVCLMHLHADVPDDALQETLRKFTGKIKQLPPIKSAVKRQWRYRKIYYLELIERKEREVLFIVGCQAGTYIRKLCSDIGDALGCGAHMAQLRRTKAAGFSEAHAVTMQDLADALHYFRQGDEARLRAILLPLEAGVAHLAKIWVLDSAIEPLCHGAQLKLPGIARLESDIQADDTVAVLSLRGELVLVGKALMPSKDMMGERGIAVKTEQVFMAPGTYPRMS